MSEDRVASSSVQADGFVVASDEIVQVGERELDLEPALVLVRLAVGELGGAPEVDDRLLVRVQPPSARSPARTR